jgi:hypothetical protein
MPSASKMRSMRSISCTWYCTVSRSSNSQVAFGPTLQRAVALVRDHLRAELRALFRVLLEAEQVLGAQLLAMGVAATVGFMAFLDPIVPAGRA